jgi:hypothetical protein
VQREPSTPAAKLQDANLSAVCGFRGQHAPRECLKLGQCSRALLLLLLCRHDARCEALHVGLEHVLPRLRLLLGLAPWRSTGWRASTMLPPRALLLLMVAAAAGPAVAAAAVSLSLGGSRVGGGQVPAGWPWLLLVAALVVRGLLLLVCGLLLLLLRVSLLVLVRQWLLVQRRRLEAGRACFVLVRVALLRAAVAQVLLPGLRCWVRVGWRRLPREAVHSGRCYEATLVLLGVLCA